MKTTTFNQSVKIVLRYFILIVLFTSCDKVKEIASVEIPVKPDPIEFKVTKSPYKKTVRKAKEAKTEVELYKATLDTRLDYYLKENGFSHENVSAFKLVKVEVKSKDPVDYDMSGFVGMKLYLGKQQELVAEAESVSKDKKVLTLQISIEDIGKYAKTDNLPILIKGPNPVTQDSILLQIELEFKVKVTPL